MATSSDPEDGYRRDDDRGLLIRLSLAVRRSFLAFVTTLGVVFLVLAVVFSEHVPGVYFGVISGMLAVWGVSAFVYAALGHLGLRLIGYR
ncbi:hypothetical protein [Halorussus amylolyticus]|uniref:hypothetical protein n=1 Tax=Halorussus amylolyticus TaxID=1126242 RepID=UPI0010459581|nr:hypothetical protein [Halorussus amylolyticus]